MSVGAVRCAGKLPYACGAACPSLCPQTDLVIGFHIQVYLNATQVAHTSDVFCTMPLCGLCVNSEICKVTALSVVLFKAQMVIIMMMGHDHEGIGVADACR